MALTNVYAPAGTTVLHLNGSAYSPDALGLIAVPSNMVDAAVKAGCTLPQSAQVVTTAKRPTANLTSGLMFFDSTLGKPIWRNAANSGWVDATGTAV